MGLALGLLVVGILSRFLPHLNNFSPVIAIAFFGGVYLRRSQALWMPVALLAVSDCVIGFHDTIPFTWGSMILVSLIGLGMRSNTSAIRVAGGGLLSAMVFFLVTNFGAWLTLYPHTLEGLRQCYILALPFFRATLVSTVVYTVLLFGLYEFIARRVQGTRLSFVLLGK